MLVPLTGLDTLANPMAMCSAFVFASPGPAEWGKEDTTALEEQLKGAAERVVRKWKLLSGVPKQLSKNRWAIDVPDDLEEAGKTRSLFGFTSETHQTSYHAAVGSSSPLSPLSSANSGFLPQPQIPLFRSSSVAADLSVHAKNQRPLLHLHASFFSDAVAIGVNVPHGAMDGTGMGIIVRALDSELHGREWDAPPPSEEVNPLEERLDSLLRDETVAAETAFPPVLKGYTDSSAPSAIVRIISNALWEAKYFGSLERRVFLRQSLVEATAKKVKAEVVEETGGKEYVSSADALLAWLLKAFHAGESDPLSSVAADPVYSMRPLLSAYTPSGLSPRSFDQYPHNSVVPYALVPGDPLPLSTLAKTSTASLALSLRRGLQADRVLPVLKEAWRKSAASKGPLIPTKDWPEFPSLLRCFLPFTVPHTTRWDISNQTTLGMTDLRLPGKSGKDLPLLAYYFIVVTPIDVDHYLVWQDIPGVGVTISANTRTSRWKSFEKELDKLKQEVGEV
ncbi:hypothetical protein JCM6882_008019 [Rhodosporidiobolus microsporus]